MTAICLLSALLGLAISHVQNLVGVVDWTLMETSEDQRPVGASEGVDPPFPAGTWKVTALRRVVGTTDLFLSPSPFWLYHLETDEWEKISSTNGPTSQGRGALVSSVDKYVVHGLGCKPGTEVLSSSFLWEWTSRTWHEIFITSQSQYTPRVYGMAYWPTKDVAGMHVMGGKSGFGGTDYYSSGLLRTLTVTSLPPNSVYGEWVELTTGKTGSTDNSLCRYMPNTWADFEGGLDRLYLYGGERFGFRADLFYLDVDISSQWQTVYESVPKAPVYTGDNAQPGARMGTGAAGMMMHDHRGCVYGGNGFDFGTGFVGDLAGLWCFDGTEMSIGTFSGWEFIRTEWTDDDFPDAVPPVWEGETRTPGTRYDASFEFDSGGNIYLWGGKRTDGRYAADFWCFGYFGLGCGAYSIENNPPSNGSSLSTNGSSVTLEDLIANITQLELGLSAVKEDIDELQIGQSAVELDVFGLLNWSAVVQSLVVSLSSNISSLESLVLILQQSCTSAMAEIVELRLLGLTLQNRTLSLRTELDILKGDWHSHIPTIEANIGLLLDMAANHSAVLTTTRSDVEDLKYAHLSDISSIRANLSRLRNDHDSDLEAIRAENAVLELEHEKNLFLLETNFSKLEGIHHSDMEAIRTSQDEIKENCERNVADLRANFSAIQVIRDAEVGEIREDCEDLRDSCGGLEARVAALESSILTLRGRLKKHDDELDKVGHVASDATSGTVGTASFAMSVTSVFLIVVLVCCLACVCLTCILCAKKDKKERESVVPLQAEPTRRSAKPGIRFPGSADIKVQRRDSVTPEGKVTTLQMSLREGSLRKITDRDIQTAVHNVEGDVSSIVVELFEDETV